MIKKSLKREIIIILEVLNWCFFFSAKAEAYKEDGNYAYKNKKFHDAIVAYTEGIKAKCNNVELNAILYTNRATAQWCLGKLSYWWSIILIHQVYFKIIDGKKKYPVILYRWKFSVFNNQVPDLWWQSKVRCLVRQVLFLHNGLSL